LRRLVSVLLVVLLAGCASAPAKRSSTVQRPVAPVKVTSSTADQAAAHAAKMIGRPYRYGGATPSGFDCSGLVYYGFRQAGVRLPHSTEQQRSLGKPVRIQDIRRGDLIFFNQEGKRFGHVGIYLGRGMFVHAPSSGKTVRSDRLEGPYWSKHVTEVRRLGGG
jgi:cell wall-associated NlpC family hydrolase